MIELNKIINKPVISLYNCQCLGLVSNCYVSKKWKCKYIEITNNNVQYIIETSKLLSYDNDSIIIRNSAILNLKESVELQLNQCSTLLNLDIYSTSGRMLGKINNIIFDTKYNIVSVKTDKDIELAKNSFFNISNQILLVKEPNTNIKISNCKPKSFPTAKSPYSKISVNIESETILESTPPKQNPIINKPTISDTSILIDRTSTKPIISNNGEVICRANARITHDIVKKARVFGKLFELIKCSK